MKNQNKGPAAGNFPPGFQDSWLHKRDLIEEVEFIEPK